MSFPSHLPPSTLPLPLIRSTALPTEIIHSIFKAMKNEQISNAHQGRFGMVSSTWRAVSLDNGEYYIRSLESLFRLLDVFSKDLGRCNGVRRLVLELDFLAGSVVEAMRGIRDLLEMSMNLGELELRLELCFEATVVVQEWTELFAVMGRLVKLRKFVVRGVSLQVDTLFELLQSWRGLKVLDLSTEGVRYDNYLDGTHNTSSTELQAFLSTRSLEHFPRLSTLRYLIRTPNDLPVLDTLFSTSNLRSLHILHATPTIDPELAVLLRPVLPDLRDFRHSSFDDENENRDSTKLFDTTLLSSLIHCETLHLSVHPLPSLSFLPALKRLRKLTLVNVRSVDDFEEISGLSRARKGKMGLEIGFQYAGYVNLRTREWLRVIKEECEEVGVGFCPTSIVPWALCSSFA